MGTGCPRHAAVSSQEPRAELFGERDVARVIWSEVLAQLQHASEEAQVPMAPDGKSEVAGNRFRRTQLRNLTLKETLSECGRQLDVAERRHVKAGVRALDLSGSAWIPAREHRYSTSADASTTSRPNAAHALLAPRELLYV
jgi:hypothetical protein